LQPWRQALTSLLAAPDAVAIHSTNPTTAQLNHPRMKGNMKVGTGAVKRGQPVA
jgi:hypothetical protein